jgi:hypothetical protein
MNYLPMTLCDLVIIGNRVDNLGVWEVKQLTSRGIDNSKDIPCLIADPYVVTLVAENIGEEIPYVLSAYNEDSGFHLVAFYTRELANQYIEKIKELLTIDNRIVKNPI